MVQERTITINGHVLQLKGEDIALGKAQLTVKTADGEFKDDSFCGLYDDEDALPRMLFESLCPLDEAEKYPTYSEWCRYMDWMGDTFSKRSPKKFEGWRKELAAWQKIAGGLTCDEVLQELNDNYSI